MEIKRLQQRLIENGEKQYVVARKCGIPAPRLSDYIHGRRIMTIPHMIALCEYLKCNPEELAGSEGIHDVFRVG